MRRTGYEYYPEKREEANLVDTEQGLLMAILGRSSSSSGVSVTPLKISGLATVFACLRVRYEAMASLPLILWKGDGNDGNVKAYDHALYSLMNDAPNDDMTSFDFMAAMEGMLSLRDNCYAEIMRDSDGDPVGLYPIEPWNMNVDRGSDLKLRYRVTNTGAQFRVRDILHIKGYTVTGLMGLDKTNHLADVFGLALALQENAAKFFSNGSKLGGVLEHPAQLGDEAQERLKNQIENSTTGRNAYRTLVLEEGMKYAATRSENRDSQFQEAREFQDLQICRIFGVPPHKVGILNSNPKANVEQENLSFVSDVLRPNCVRWEKALNLRLLSREERDQGYHFEFDLDDIRRGDIVSRYTAYGISRQWGWSSANDILKAEKKNKLAKNGDIYLQPVNMVPAGQAPAPEPGPTKMGPDGKPIAGAAPKPVKQEDPNLPQAPDEDKNTPELLGKPREINGSDSSLT